MSGMEDIRDLDQRMQNLEGTADGINGDLGVLWNKVADIMEILGGGMGPATSPEIARRSIASALVSLLSGGEIGKDDVRKIACDLMKLANGM
eukprot:381175_1